MDEQCPKCAGRLYDVVKTMIRRGREVKVLRCVHCGKSWRGAPADEVDLDAVKYCPVKCPLCGGTQCRVTKSMKPIRYHKCDCGYTFKSVES